MASRVLPKTFHSVLWGLGFTRLPGSAVKLLPQSKRGYFTRVVIYKSCITHK